MDKAYHQAAESLAATKGKIDLFFRDNHLDAMLLPGGTGSEGSYGVELAAVDGYPIVSLLDDLQRLRGD